jgi:hypothetical protein
MTLLEKISDEIEVVSADKAKVDTFIRKHYLQSWPSGVKKIFLIVRNGKSVGTIIYGLPFPTASKFLEPEVNHDEIWELKRLYIKDMKDDKNLESYVIAKSLKLIKTENPEVKVVISFADEKAGHQGKIYQATNMLYLGSINGKHKYAYILRGNLNAIRSKMNSRPYPK